MSLDMVEFCGNDPTSQILVSGLLLEDDKTQQPPFLHTESALKSPKQQPTPQSCLSSHSLDMLSKSHPWDAYERQEWWLLHQHPATTSPFSPLNSHYTQQKNFGTRMRHDNDETTGPKNIFL